MRSGMTSRWSGLRAAYPRMVAGTVVVIGFLLVTDLVLVYERLRYGRELARSSAALIETERRRVEAIVATEENRLALAVELARREALGDTELHLAVDVQRSLLYLQRQGARLREMRVRMGGQATVGSPPDAVVLAPPLGKRSVTRVVDGSYRWTVPEWVYVDRGLPAPPEREIPEALGPLTVFLDGGAILYALPAVGPLSDASYVLPGSVRAEAKDLAAIRENQEATDGREIVVDGRLLVPPLGTRQRRYEGVLGTHRLNMGNGYAIHGTNQPKSVGQAVSHGCVRMRNGEIAELYPSVPVGTPVYIY